MQPDFAIQKLSGESKVRMLSLNEKTNAVVRKINQGATELKQNFGVTYPFESEVDEPEWTGLDLSLHQAHNPDRHLLDSPVPQILPRYHYPQSTSFPSKFAEQKNHSLPLSHLSLCIMDSHRSLEVRHKINLVTPNLSP